MKKLLNKLTISQRRSLVHQVVCWGMAIPTNILIGILLWADNQLDFGSMTAEFGIGFMLMFMTTAVCYKIANRICKKLFDFTVE